jgi:hypothetical protein
MGADARIRWISKNGLEMVWKAVKTAVKHHGGGLEEGADVPSQAPRRGPQPLSTWSRHDRGRNHHFRLRPRGAGRCGAYTDAFGGSVGISQRCKDPSLMGFGEFRRVLLRASEDH